MRMPEKTVLFGATTISGLLVAAALLWRVDTRPAAVPAPATTPEVAAAPETPALSPSPAPPQGENQREVTLFFQSPEADELMPEKRKIFLTESVGDQARQTVKELIDGSRSGLLPTMPAGSEVKEVYLSADGTAYVDLSKSFVDRHPGGSTAEIGTIFSLVDTLAFNFPEIKRVKFLVEGEERATLKDHLDLSRPYVADMSIVKRQEER